MVKNITLRQHGRSIGMTVPVEFCHALGLAPGDSVTWETDGDVATLRFFKVTKQRVPALEKQEEAVAAAT
jgi:antitoxin component of MazEF toxin-antitoxin module